MVCFRALKSTKGSKVKEAIETVRAECRVVSNKTPTSKYVLRLLTAHFDEDEDAVIRYFEVGTLLKYRTLMRFR